MKHHLYDSRRPLSANTEVTLPLRSYAQNIRIYREIALLSWQPKIPIKCIGEYGSSMQHLKWLSCQILLLGIALKTVNILEIYLLMFWKYPAAV